MLLRLEDTKGLEGGRKSLKNSPASVRQSPQKTLVRLPVRALSPGALVQRDGAADAPDRVPVLVPGVARDEAVPGQLGVGVELAIAGRAVDGISRRRC